MEEMEGTYIATVTMFPFMGYTHMDEEEGYMFIPDGNGALIYMDNKEGRYPTGFNQMIYGSDVGFVESGEKVYLWEKLDMRNKANKILAPILAWPIQSSRRDTLPLWKRERSVPALCRSRMG